jgi:16S rRNA processing protein RimM
VSATKKVIAKITSYHGIKGELKVFLLMDNIAEFDSLETVYINDKDFEIESFREHKKIILLKLKGIDTRNQAEELTGYVSAVVNEELNSNEIFLEDLIGKKLIDINDKLLGEITGFYDNKQLLLRAKLFENNDDGGEILLPFVEEYIIEIAEDKSFLRVNLTDDLINLNR